MNFTIVVPSLNPDEKLLAVVEGLLKAGFNDLVLVNDGSDELHAGRFAEAAQYPQVTVLTHKVNRGKGRALKTAFDWILANRPETDGVITVDGDNQHLPEDVMACAEVFEKEPTKVWLGVRNFSEENVPFRSKLGNGIMRFIVRLACGTKISDTQTGLRVFPFGILPFLMTVEGERYEYETQMLLSFRKENIGIGEVVIHTVYIDNNESSHYDTFRDSWKIFKIIFRHFWDSIKTVVKYAASSLIAFLVDNGLFTLFHTVVFTAGTAASSITLSTYLARVISSVVNFILNRRMVFRSRSSVLKTGWKYFLLVVIQATVSGLLVTLLSKITGSSGLWDTLIKIVIEAILFFVNYFVQKKWIFAK